MRILDKCCLVRMWLNSALRSISRLGFSEFMSCSASSPPGISKQLGKKIKQLPFKNACHASCKLTATFHASAYFAWLAVCPDSYLTNQPAIQSPAADNLFMRACASPCSTCMLLSCCLQKKKQTTRQQPDCAPA